MMNKIAFPKTTFKFLDAQLMVKRTTPDPIMLLALNSTLSKGGLAWYKGTRVELKTFTFSAGSKFLSIDNAVLGPVPKLLLFTMVKNADFIGTMVTNPYKFQHYDISDFSLFVNGKQYPNEGLSLGMDNEKTSVMRYRTLFEGSDIHHSNAGHRKHTIYLLTAISCYSLISRPSRALLSDVCGREDLIFAKPLHEASTCLLYLEFDNSVLIHLARNVTTDY